MSNKLQEQKEKDFLENRTSWKYFNRLLQEGKNPINEGTFGMIQCEVLVQILKELQYLNDNN